MKTVKQLFKYYAIVGCIPTNLVVHHSTGLGLLSLLLQIIGLILIIHDKSLFNS